ncbi:hypothetical protein BD410DRAFT_819675 [Rickenella mellea]|uniref:Uncharacterized protein n=1 Tax=Rickenella mellea TaxID=50990 RepID=A0A4Y7QD59_9AGAM|nr:hypothetical protein BD410DRAFT_819675 [Rickenella mellea]
MSSDDTLHGLDYPPNFLHNLPVLLPRSAPHSPVRAIDAAQFADIHLAHFTSDVNDSVLFPFLHGLEGNNHAQNTFFAGTGGLSRLDNDAARAGVVSVPRYRGLIWVACEEDEAGNTEESDEDDEDYDFDDEDGEEDMQVDSPEPEPELVPSLDPNEQPHMHPQALRKPSHPISIDTTPNPALSSDAHDRRLSTSSSTTTTTTTSSSEGSHFGFESTSASYSTTCTSPATDIEIDDCIPAVPPSASLPPDSPFPEKYIPRDGLPLLTSTFSASDLLTTAPDGGPMFIPSIVPDGISLRNFGIQVPIYATLSDIVVFSRSGCTSAACALAERFKLAIERVAAERSRRYENAGLKVDFISGQNPALDKKDGEGEASDSSQTEKMDGEGQERTPREPRASLVAYNVFVVSDTLPTIVEKVPWLLSSPPPGRTVSSDHHDGSDTKPAEGFLQNHHETNGHAISAKGISDREWASVERRRRAVTGVNAVDFAQREREEMRELTKASPILGDCVFLGNSNDVPLPIPWRQRHLKAMANAERKAHDVFDDWDGKAVSDEGEGEGECEGEDDPFDGTDNPAGYDLCIECRDYAPFPTSHQLRQAEAHLAALDALWSARRFAAACAPATAPATPEHHRPEEPQRDVGSPTPTPTPVSSSAPSSPAPGIHGGGSLRTPRPAPCASQVVHLSFPASPPSHAHALVGSLLPFLSFLSTLISPRQAPPSTRRKKILIYSGDGYTESSVLALCLLMKERALGLPDAYLTLQVDLGRSFFVYQSDLGVLKRVEAKLGRERDPLALPPPTAFTRPIFVHSGARVAVGAATVNGNATTQVSGSGSSSGTFVHGRAASTSISYPANGRPVVVPSQNPAAEAPAASTAAAPTHPLRRPRASTSPLLPPHVDHQTWFNDPRFDGSFPSRVLPFLYLGNLNHASNAYMLHALGITHVVSVGECALVPPVNVASADSASGYHLVVGKGPGGQGSLWMEEREGRIKVLDIKGVCDDGIDSLQPQLEPVCDWIDRARSEGGKVLVHCRVGVSRSATVTIAYVMKHLALPLVDAYLIVRSRRLSVLIQPNMRLLYNLCGWEVKLARERAQDDVAQLRRELARSLNWPYLAREVHRLNEKYLQ